MAETLARRFVIASCVCVAAVILATQVEDGISEGYRAPQPVRWLEDAVFVGFVAFGWLALPFAIKARNTGLAVAAAASVVLSSVSLAVVVWLRASGCC